MKRIAVLLIFCALFTSACTSTKWVRTTVAKQYDFNVALEHYQEEGHALSKDYDHPYAIDVPVLEKLMGDLQYTEEGGLMSSEKQSPVFQAVEIERLAPVLVEALAKADAVQRVRFTSFNQGKSLLFSVPRKTEGVVFVEPAGRLNVAFNLVNSKRQPSEATAIDPIYSSTDPLRVKASEIAISAPVLYAEHHEFETGEQAPMWVVADMDKLKQAIDTATVPIVDVREEATMEVAPKAAAEAASVEKTATDQAPEDKLKEDIRSNLKYLKELLDEGLISEEDYTAKKMELLDKIK